MSSIFEEESVQNEVTATEFKVSAFLKWYLIGLETEIVHRELKRIKKHPTKKTHVPDFADGGVFLELRPNVTPLHQSTNQAREVFIYISPTSW